MDVRLSALLLLLLSSGVPAVADQTDPRLDQLFDRLQQAPGPDTVRSLERSIWAIWYSYPSNPALERLLRVGEVAMNIGELDAAEAVFGDVINEAPAFAEAWNRRATVRFIMGDYPGSITDVAQTLILEPRHFGALSGLGMIYSRLDRDEEALAAFQAALEVHPEMPGIQEAVRDLQEALNGEPL